MQLEMPDPIAIGYPDNSRFLPLWKCVEITIYLTGFTAQQLLCPSCRGSFCRCGTCTNDICGSWCTPITLEGSWVYLLHFLWPLHSYLCTRPQSPTWYSQWQLGEGNDESFWYIQGDVFLIVSFLCLSPWVPLMTNPLYFHKLRLQNLTHIPSVFPLPYIFSLYGKTLHNPAICIEGLPPSIPMNALGWWLTLDGFTAAIIVIIYFSDYTSVFLTTRSLWFPWLLVYIGIIIVTCNPYGIKNSLMSGINLLDNVAAMYNGNIPSRGSASILKKNRA